MRSRFILMVSIAALMGAGCGDDDDTGSDAAVDAGDRDMRLMVDGGPPTDAGPGCGNGVTEPPERCDGDCPTECDDGVACTADVLEGSAAACSAMCSFTEITACADGDGCCPGGCDSTTDDDCSATCGNGTTEPPETCDGDCPTECDDSMACTTDTLVGSADSCSASCSFVAIDVCTDDDGCCPAGCDTTTDNDCSATCGNGVVEAPEVCDGDCPISCDDSVACTTDTLVGSASSCSASCSFAPIDACTDGDGCCPTACNATTDDDCSPSCGNGVVEAPEVCDGDCPTACDDGMVCTTDTLVGSAASCSAMCSASAITVCDGSDGCCPSGCDASSDADCLAPVISGTSRTTVALGTSFTVMGAALGTVSMATIGGTTQGFTLGDATMLTVTVADGTTVGTAQSLVVTSPDGSSNAFMIDVVDRLAVTGAVATDAVTVEVTFNRAVDAATVAAVDFTVPGLMVTGTTVSGSTVTLTTSMQTAGTTYTVTATNLTDTFGNELNGTASAMFSVPLAPVVITDFGSGVTAMSHPEGAGAYEVWYDATNDASADAMMSTLEGLPALDVIDGGFTNGVYAIYQSVIPAAGNYRLEMRMHVVEGTDLDGIGAYQVGVATGAAAVHRAPNPSDLAPLTTVGNYPMLTAGDDTAIGPVTVTTATFSASAGDDLLIAFSTDVTSGDWNANANFFMGGHILVGNITLVPVP